MSHQTKTQARLYTATTPAPVIIIDAGYSKSGARLTAVLLSDRSVVRYAYEAADAACHRVGIYLAADTNLLKVDVTPKYFRSLPEYTPNN